jgi:hypothetical protein
MRVSGAMTIGQIQIAHADWGKERLDGHTAFLDKR